MYFATPARALAHNTTPVEPKLNTRKYHTFISHLTPFHSIFSLLNLTPSPIVPTFYSPIEESDEALVVWCARERERLDKWVRERDGARERARITKTEKVWSNWDQYTSYIPASAKTLLRSPGTVWCRSSHFLDWVENLFVFVGILKVLKFYKIDKIYLRCFFWTFRFAFFDDYDYYATI